MDSNWYFVLIGLNAVAIAAASILPIRSGRTIQYFAGFVIAANIVCLYVWFVIEGLDYAYIEILSIRFPYILYLGLGIALVLISDPARGRQPIWRVVLVALIALVAASSKSVSGAAAILYGSGPYTERILQMILFSAALQICVFGTLPMAVAGGESIRRILLPRLSDFRIHITPLALGFTFVLVILIARSLIVHGTPLVLNDMTYSWRLIPKVLFLLLYILLVNHYVSIFVAKRVLDVIFPDDESSLLEVVMFAVLFAALHYDYGMSDLLAAFFFGLGYGYLYLKTRTIAYGIILNALMILFTL